MNFTNDKFYFDLRNKLDKLGYTQPFGLESISLINALLNDFVYQQEKLSYEVFPKVNPSIKFIDFKSHLATLLKKVCELNETLLKDRKNHSQENFNFKCKLKQLEEDNANYRFRETELIKNIKQLETESREKSKLLLKLEEINLKAIIETPGGSRAPIPFKREKMFIDSFLPLSDVTNRSMAFGIPQKTSSPKGNDGKNVHVSHNLSDSSLPSLSLDILQVAEAQIKNLTVKLAENEVRRNEIERELLCLNEEVAAKEAIIERFVGPIEYDKLLKGPARVFHSVDRKLTTTNDSHPDNALVHMADKVLQKHQPTSLEDSLLLEEIELEKLSRLKDSNSEYTDAFLKKLVENVDHLKTKYEQLKTYLKSLEKHNLVDNIKYLEKEQETLNLIEELENLGEKTKLIQKSLSTANPKPFEPGAEQSPHFAVGSRTDDLNDVEAGRDGNPILKSLHLVNLARAKSNATKFNSDAKGSKESVNVNVGFKTTNSYPDLRFNSDLQDGPKKADKGNSDVLKEKEKELDRVNRLYKRNLETKSNLTYRINQLIKHEKELLQELDNLHHKTFLRSSGYSNNSRLALKAKTDNLISDLDKDRNYYKDEYLFLTKFVENHINQRDKSKATSKNVVSDDDCKNLTSRTREIKINLDKALIGGSKIYRTDAIPVKTSDHSPGPSDDFLTIEKLIEEKEELQRLLDSCELQNSNLQSAFDKLTVEKDELFRKLTGDRKLVGQNEERQLDRIDYFEKENKRLKLDFKAKEEEFNKRREELETQLTNLIKMTEQLNADRIRLNEKHKAIYQEMEAMRSHLESEKENSRELKDIMFKVTNESVELKQNNIPVTELQQSHAVIKELHSKFSSLQGEVLKLHAKLSELETSNVTLQKLCDDKERTIVSLHSTMRKLESRIDELNAQLTSKSRESQNLLKDNSHLQHLYEKDRAVFLEENKILRDDIAALTEEHKKLNEELTELRHDNRQLIDKTDVTDTQIKSIEQILNAKEQEKRGFLDQCNGLEKQIEALRKQKKNSECELQNLKYDISSKEDQIGLLNRKVNHLQSELNEHKDPLSEQMNNIQNRTVERLQEEVRNRKVEADRLRSDISRLEKVCEESRKTQSSLKIALDLKQADTVELIKTIDDFKRDFKVLRAEVDNRRQSMQTLNQILECSRKRETDLKMYCRKLEAKIRQIKTSPQSRKDIVSPEDREAQPSAPPFSDSNESDKTQTTSHASKTHQPTTSSYRHKYFDGFS